MFTPAELRFAKAALRKGVHRDEIEDVARQIKTERAAGTRRALYERAVELGVIRPELARLLFAEERFRKAYLAEQARYAELSGLDAAAALAQCEAQLEREGLGPAIGTLLLADGALDEAAHAALVEQLREPAD